MDELGKETAKWKGKGVSDMSEWNYGRWALNLRSLRADLLQVLLWSEHSETATATSSNSWLNSWLLNRPSAMLSGRLPGQSATLPINMHQNLIEQGEREHRCECSRECEHGDPWSSIS